MDIEILEQTKLSNDRIYFKISIDSKEEVDLWGIPDNVLVTRKYRPDIEKIIFEFNNTLNWTSEEVYFYHLRYFIKDTPKKYEDEIRNFVITGKSNYIKHINNAPFPTYIFYNKEDNVMIPLCYCDWITNNYKEFKKIIVDNFGELALTTTYALVAKFTILRQIHYLWFVKDYSKRYLLLEDSAIHQEQLENIHNTFIFTCPVCKDKHTPAGIAELPKPFYNNNKEMLSINNFGSFQIEISDPYVVLNNFKQVADIMQLVSDNENPIKISYHQYKKIEDSEYFKSTYYQDYINMAKTLGVNYLLPWEIHSERQLKSIHDALVIEYNLRKNTSPEEIKQKYLKIKTSYPKFEYNSEKFLIKYPSDIDELSVEGSTLHHCVGSYKKRVLDQEDIIVFLRKFSEPDTPFVTMQLKNINSKFDLVQAHGLYNCSIKKIDDVYDFVQKWCRNFNINMEEIDRVL